MNAQMTNAGRDSLTQSRRGRHHVEFVMGMAVSIDIRDDLPSDALDEVVQWLHHVDATYSTYIPDSPISRVGLGIASAEDMTREVGEVVALCEELRDDTGGAFDAFVVPAPNGSHFDPSGVVKGWSIERAATILERHGATNFCINAGGDIALRGHARPGEPWLVGIRHPDLPDRSAAVVAGADRLAIATSATYERGAHIIDPSTGEPTADLASVTIIGPDLTYADAYATAVFVMGPDGLNWLTRRHPDYAAFLITRRDTALSTSNFADHRVS
ncbi:MAG: thiamine biosynthesis protein [Ilumatobacteraceae bacterium]|nr:thiamine biosynthesis protein [Ilumatobacteraceae bacterium]